MRKFHILGIDLIRDLSKYDKFDEKKVTGVLQIRYSKRNKFGMYRIETLENRDYVFPEGVYPLHLEYSPKFNTHLFEFKEIQGRSEIKFHQGTVPEHSKGCPLLSRNNLNLMRMVLHQQKKYYIRVVNY